jgi:hypothetical protein
LYEQLTAHHDSRFLAALIFSLFFSFQVSPMVRRGVDQPETTNHQEMKGDQNMVIWNYAVAAIALAVKVRGLYFNPGSFY